MFALSASNMVQTLYESLVPGFLQTLRQEALNNIRSRLSVASRWGKLYSQFRRKETRKGNSSLQSCTNFSLPSAL